jgi:hypothetical protein
MIGRGKSVKKGAGMMRWGDFLVIAVVVLTSLSLWSRIFLAGATEGRTVEVVAEGVIVLRYELDTGKLLYTNADIDRLLDEYEPGTDEENHPMIRLADHGVHFVLLLRDGKVRFAESDCPDRVCVNTGFISLSGQIAACVPAGVLVRVTGVPSEDDPDIIIG